MKWKVHLLLFAVQTKVSLESDQAGYLRALYICPPHYCLFSFEADDDDRTDDMTSLIPCDNTFFSSHENDHKEHQQEAHNQ